MQWLLAGVAAAPCYGWIPAAARRAARSGRLGGTLLATIVSKPARTALSKSSSVCLWFCITPHINVPFHIEYSTLRRAGSRNSFGRATAVAAPGVFSCRDCGGGAWRQWHRPAVTPGPCLARCCIASTGVACSLPPYGRAPAGASLRGAFDVTLAEFHCIENN